MLRWTKNKSEETPPQRLEREGVAATPPETPRSSAPAAGHEGGGEINPAKKSLPELLLSQGKITEEQLERALSRQRDTGEFIGEILIQEGALSESSLITFLAKHCRIPHLSLLDYLIDQEILGLVPNELCLQYRLLPIDKLGHNLTVAMVNPLDSEALEQVRRCCPELRIKPILCAYHHFETVTQKLFGAEKKTAPLELSASSLGLSLPKKPVSAPKPAAPTPAPDAASQEAEEELPEAIVELEVPGELERDAILHQVFREEAEIATAGENHDAAKSRLGAVPGVVQDVASVMIDSMRDTYAMLARRVELFRDLLPEEVARIFAQGMTQEYEAGKVIFGKGAPGKELFVILGGAVEIYDGDRVIAVLERGDMFGEMALVSCEPRSASARAAITTSVLALNNDLLKSVLPRDMVTKLLTNIVVTLSARLRQANEQWLIGQHSNGASAS